MHHPRRARPTSLDPVQTQGESQSHRSSNGSNSKGHHKKKHRNKQPWTHDAAAAHSLGIAAGRPFVAPRNLGPNAKSRQDGSLSLDCHPMRAKPKPAVNGYLPPRRPPVVGRDGWNGKSYDKIPDPMAGAWEELQTGQRMNAMMTIGDAPVARQDRNVLVEWYDEFIGGGREASTEHHAQAGWLFWPGGWHAGQGWWADSDVEYTLEAATMRDEVAAEAILVEEKEAALAAAIEYAKRTKEWHNNLKADASKWDALSEDEQYRANQKLSFAERGIVPKRLHRVTAHLQHDVSEARRQKLKPPGREGAWQHGAGGGGGLGDNEEGEEGEEGGEARLGPEDVSSWHGVKVDRAYKQVTALALPYHNIQGPLRAAVRHFLNLKLLAELHLVGNHLSGAIPPEISQLRSLRLLLLRANQLTGTLPDSIGDLMNLVALDVSRNRLEGTIPATYKNCASLQVLNVGDNLLSGPIQCLDEFTSLKSLRYLSLEGNSFHGFLSVSFSDLPKLRVLNLSRNQLAGAVPRGLAQLRDLVSLDLSANQFSGALPLLRPNSDYSQPALRQMRLHGNEDLLAPDLWLYHETPRFRIERAAAARAATKDGSQTSKQQQGSEGPSRNEDVWKGRARGGPGAASVTNAKVLKQMLYGPYRESLVPGGLGSLSWHEVTAAMNIDMAMRGARGGECSSRGDGHSLLATQAVHRDGDEFGSTAETMTQQAGEGEVTTGGLGSTYVADENLLLNELKQLEMPAPI